MYARFRFGALWLSQVGRVMSDHCFRIYVVLKAAEGGPSQRDAAWHFVVALFVLPSILLCPLIGPTINSLPKRCVLKVAAGFCFIAIGGFILVHHSWFLCLGLVAVGSAIYSPTRYALLPAAAVDTRMPLARINGWIEMGTALAIVGGTLLGGYLSASKAFLDGQPGASSALAINGSPLAIIAAFGLSALGFVASLPVRFASDVRRRETPGQALAGLLTDCRRIWENRETRFTLIGLASFRGLVAGITGAAIARSLSQGSDGSLDSFGALITIALWIMVGAAAGSLIAGIQGHPRRALGLVPFGAAGLFLVLVLTCYMALTPWLCILLGITGGLLNVPLNAAYQRDLPADARGNGLTILSTAGYLVMTFVSLLLAGLTRLQFINPIGQMVLVTGLTGLGAIVAWRGLFREAIEQTLEIILWPIHRIRGYGPGLLSCPQNGPVIVFANHSSWFDPLWVGKVLPRRLIPMMTSVFYDLRALRFLMTRVVHAIRVESSTYRREAPELKEAIAALDRGECVTIFPEGMMRRREDQALRQFGQGIWHMLRERPNTPVIACWIEGGWRSFTSYFNGPPLTNKRMDLWRHIDIGVSNPEVVDQALLVDHRATRSYLMQACLEARRHLGLKPLEASAIETEPALASD